MRRELAEQKEKVQLLKAELARAKSKMVEGVVAQSLKSEDRGDHGRRVKKDNWEDQQQHN